MRDFLIEMFEINRDANIKIVADCQKLASPEECVRLLSHLANCQYKWLDRIKVFPEESTLDWWNPIYYFNELPHHFKNSAQEWIDYLSEATDQELEYEKKYLGYDHSAWQSKLKDIALQLIFHSFHHRAQIQMLIRAQGEKPSFIDYIGYKAKKTGAS